MKNLLPKYKDKVLIFFVGLVSMILYLIILTLKKVTSDLSYRIFFVLTGKNNNR